MMQALFPSSSACLLCLIDPFKLVNMPTSQKFGRVERIGREETIFYSMLRLLRLFVFVLEKGWLPE